MPTSDDFRQQLLAIFEDAEARGLSEIDVEAGDLHRRAGEYPGRNHRMPACYEMMRSEMRPDDSVVSEPPSGQGASLKVTYKLPRTREQQGWLTRKTLEVLAIIGTGGTVIGIALALYFYYAAKTYVAPTFVLDPFRTEIIDSERLAATPIRVTRRDGSEIRSDLTSVRFYFWNDGNLAIRREHMLEPLRISVAAGKILEAKIVGISRRIIGFSVSPDPADPERTVILDFRILEEDDGITGQILYEGSPEAELRITGTIEGAKMIRTLDHQEVTGHRGLWTLLIFFLAGVSVMKIVRVIVRRVRNSKRLAGVLQPSSVHVLTVAVSIILLFGFYMLVHQLVHNLRSETIPETIQSPERNL